MKIINNDYGFSFEISDSYTEVKKEDYKKFHLDETTLHVFTKLEGKAPKSISINRDDECPQDSQYLQLIQLNINNMQKMGMEILNRSFITTESGRRIDKTICVFKDLKFCVYFTRVKKILISASIVIGADRDKNEAELYNIFASIKEL